MRGKRLGNYCSHISTATGTSLVKTAIKSSWFAGSFLGMKLGSIFFTLRWLGFARIFFLVISLHKGDAVKSINKIVSIGNRFHVNSTHPQFLFKQNSIWKGAANSDKRSGKLTFCLQDFVQLYGVYLRITSDSIPSFELMQLLRDNGCYSGCGGNMNNFESRQACRQQCIVGACCVARMSGGDRQQMFVCRRRSLGHCKRINAGRQDLQVVWSRAKMLC